MKTICIFLGGEGLPPCLLFVKYNLVLRGDQITDWVQENELPLAWAFLKRREYELKYQANCTGRQAKATYLFLANIHFMPNPCLSVV